MGRKLTTEEWIEKAIAVWGNRYGYDRVDYVNAKTKVEIWCPVCGEYYLCSPDNHLRGRGCPVCSGRKVSILNCLATINPSLANEWHPTKNGNLTPCGITSKSGQKVWWKCKKGVDHEWKDSVSHRSSGRGCPICSGRKVVKSNSLAQINPSLANEWHPTKNGNLTPYNVVVNSHKRVWWKCEKDDDHEWMAIIKDRSRGNGCPICSGRKVVKSNSLEMLNPRLAREWHPTKNGNLTPYNVTIKSNKQVWWKCEKDDNHEWKSRIGSRTIGNGCPFCSTSATSWHNLSEEFHDEPANLYYLKFTHDSGEVFYKIGHSKNFNKRLKSFQKSLYQIEVLHIEEGRRIDMINKEMEYHKEFAEWSYCPEHSFGGGETECYSEDVLGLDPSVSDGLPSHLKPLQSWEE